MGNQRLTVYIQDSLLEWLPSIKAEQAGISEQLSILIDTKGETLVSCSDIKFETLIPPAEYIGTPE